MVKIKTEVIMIILILLLTIVTAFNLIKPEMTASVIVGNVDVAVQDQVTLPINLYFSENLANITLNTNYNIGDKQISINSPVAPVVDNLICLKEGSAFYQEEITAVTAQGANNYLITLRSPLDFDFTTAGGCSIRNNDLSVDGSVTPRTFTISPTGLNVSWHINKVIFHCEDETAMDSSKFCGMTALPNGLVLTRVNGVTKKLLTIETNGDFNEHDAPVIYETKAPAGVYSMYATKTFNGHDYSGVALEIMNNTGDTLKVTVYDNLIPINHLHVVAIGHVVYP